jgi:hypothetical protein
MDCKLCQSEMDEIYQAKMLGKYDVLYFHCPDCEFIQTEKEFWLEEAYHESINISDTGYLRRNLVLTKVVTSILMLFFPSNVKCLDYAGGYGVFVRMMRDIGYDFFWQDKYTQNIFSRGFEQSHQEQFGVVTTFESFEHFDKPLNEIENMLKLSDSILFSTILYGNQIPQPDWPYFGLEHGQHIAFYNLKSLTQLAKKYQLYFYSDRKSVHLFTKKKINPILFYLVVKVARLGLGDFLFLFKRSKTLADWELMRKK